MGAGISGITAAYFAAQQGRQVRLVEASPKAGGLLRSDSTRFGCFDYGTHIASHCGVPDLDDFLFGGMDEEDYYFFNPGKGGNYFAGALSEICPFVDIACLAPPMVEMAESQLLNTAPSAIAANLEQALLQRFGAVIYREIMAGVVQKFMGCDASLLSPETLCFFDMNRVLAFDPERTVALKEDSRFDDALGFHGARPGLPKAYPRRGGIEFWVESLLQKLQSVGVDYLPNTKLSGCSSVGGRVTHIDLEGERLAVDEVIWTVPAGLFASLADSHIAFPKPKFRGSLLYDFAFASPLLSDCYFINVYDDSKLSGRVTLYQNLHADGEFYGCTVEVLQSHTADKAEESGRIQDELAAMGLVDADNQCVYTNVRRVPSGFPIPETGHTKRTMECADALDAEFSNVLFLGRSSKRFFMTDVLRHAYGTVSGVYENATKAC